MLKNTTCPGIMISDRNSVARSQEWRCNLCKRLLPAKFRVNYIQPKALGGLDQVSNLQALCETCYDSCNRESVACLQKWRCKICNQLLPARYQVDHIRPKALGGLDEASNLQALCGTCHDSKTLDDMRILRDIKKEKNTGKSKYFAQFSIFNNLR